MNSVLRMIPYRAVLLLLICLVSPLTLASEALKVVVSIKPIHSLVAGLMEDIAQPQLLYRSSRTPYDSEQTDIHIDEDADLVIWVGAELEQSLQEQIENLPQSVTVLELLSSDRIKVLPSRQNFDHRDPFFWVDGRNMLILLDDLTRELIKLDPMRAHIYTRNRLNMIKPLKRIDKEYEYGYRGLKAGLGVMYFDTLQYFEQAYALESLGFVAASPRSPLQAKNLLKVRQLISQKQVDCLFVDKSMPVENLQLLGLSDDINIGELDVFGAQFNAGPDLYIKLMDFNTDVIKNCINANRQVAASVRQAAIENSDAVIDGLGGRFILTTHLNEAFSELDMQGHYSLVYFGYTHCPDICPTSLTVMSRALKMLQDQGNKQVVDKLRPYFITVDPERDTALVMREYVRYFDSQLVGLTGSVSMIKRVADQFKVRFEKVPSSIAEPQLYAMDHSAGLYLMAPNGRFVSKFAHGINAQDLASRLREYIR